MHFLVLSQTNRGYDIFIISQRSKAMPCQWEHVPPFQTENATDALMCCADLLPVVKDTVLFKNT